LLEDFLVNSIKDEDIAEAALTIIKNCLKIEKKESFTTDPMKN